MSETRQDTYEESITLARAFRKLSEERQETASVMQEQLEMLLHSVVRIRKQRKGTGGTDYLDTHTGLVVEIDHTQGDEKLWLVIPGSKERFQVELRALESVEVIVRAEKRPLAEHTFEGLFEAAMRNYRESLDEAQRNVDLF